MRFLKPKTPVRAQGHRSRPNRAKWYDLPDFLELRDVQDEEVPAAPLPPEAKPEPVGRHDFAYHRLGQPLDLDEKE